MSKRAGAFVNNLSGKMAIDANKKLTALDVLSSRIPNIDLFVSMFVRK